MADFFFKTYLELAQIQHLTGSNNQPFAQVIRDLSDTVVSALDYYGAFTTRAKDFLFYPHMPNYTLIFTCKLAVCLVFLSAIRGGVARYRYDFLTKMGWIKFLGLVLSTFLVTLTVFLLY